MPTWTEAQAAMINEARTHLHHVSVLTPACPEYFGPVGRMTVIFDEATGKGAITCLGRRSNIAEEQFGSAHCEGCSLLRPNAKIEISSYRRPPQVEYSAKLVVVL